MTIYCLGSQLCSKRQSGCTLDGRKQPTRLPDDLRKCKLNLIGILGCRKLVYRVSRIYETTGSMLTCVFEERILLGRQLAARNIRWVLSHGISHIACCRLYADDQSSRRSMICMIAGAYTDSGKTMIKV